MEAPPLIELAGHPRIRAVKDAKGDRFEAMSVMARTLLESPLPHLERLTDALATIAVSV